MRTSKTILIPVLLAVPSAVVAGTAAPPSEGPSELALRSRSGLPDAFSRTGLRP